MPNYTDQDEYDDALLERLLARLAQRPDLRARWYMMLHGHVAQAMPMEDGDEQQ